MGLTLMSLIRIWSLDVPSSAATFSLIPLTSIGAAERAALLSLVSMATRAAPAESPTKRTPSGPNAIGPADLSGALPVVRPAMLALKARAAVRQSAATNRNGVEEVTLRIFSPVRTEFNPYICITIPLALQRSRRQSLHGAMGETVWWWGSPQD